MLWLTCIPFLLPLDTVMQTLCCMAWPSHPCPFALGCHLDGTPCHQVLIDCAWTCSSSFQVECYWKLHLLLICLLKFWLMLSFIYSTNTLYWVLSVCLSLNSGGDFVCLLVSLTHIWFGLDSLKFFPSSGPWLKGFCEY